MQHRVLVSGMGWLGLGRDSAPLWKPIEALYTAAYPAWYYNRSSGLSSKPGSPVCSLRVQRQTQVLSVAVVL